MYNVIKSVPSTEKTTSLAGINIYVFKVDRRASKLSVSKAFEFLFGFKPLSVNILNTHGKKRVFRGVKGTVVGFKKAFVKVSADKNLDLGNIETI